MTSYRHQTAILKSPVTLSSSTSTADRRRHVCGPYAWPVTTAACAPGSPAAGTRFAGPTHKLLATLDGRPVFRAGPRPRRRGRPRPRRRRHRRSRPRASTTSASPIVHNPRLGATARPASLQLAIVAAAADSAAESSWSASPISRSSPPSAWRAVADAPTPTAPIVVATYDGRRGRTRCDCTVRSGRCCRPTATRAHGRLMRLHPEWVDEVACDRLSG